MPNAKPIHYDYTPPVPWHVRVRNILRRLFRLVLWTSLVVLLLLVVLSLIPVNLRGGGYVPVNATKVSLSNIKQALLAFQTDCGRYPTTPEGLDALVTAPTPAPSGWHPYMDKLPRDGWGNPFIYTSKAPGGTDFDLYSMGTDGKDGTADDIHLRDLE